MSSPPTQLTESPKQERRKGRVSMHRDVVDHLPRSANRNSPIVGPSPHPDQPRRFSQAPTATSSNFLAGIGDGAADDDEAVAATQSTNGQSSLPVVNVLTGLANKVSGAALYAVAPWRIRFRNKLFPYAVGKRKTVEKNENSSDPQTPHSPASDSTPKPITSENKSLTTRGYYDWAMTIICLLFIGVSAASDYSDPACKGSRCRVVMSFDLAINIIFIIETILHVVAFGARKYLHPIRLADVILLALNVGLWASFMGGNLSMWPSLLIFRTVRVFRPMITTTHFPALRTLIVALFKSIFQLTDVVLLFVLLLVWFAVAGTNQMSGNLRKTCVHDSYFERAEGTNDTTDSSEWTDLVADEDASDLNWLGSTLGVAPPRAWWPLYFQERTLDSYRCGYYEVWHATLVRFNASYAQCREAAANTTNATQLLGEVKACLYQQYFFINATAFSGLNGTGSEVDPQFVANPAAGSLIPYELQRLTDGDLDNAFMSTRHSPNACNPYQTCSTGSGLMTGYTCPTDYRCVDSAAETFYFGYVGFDGVLPSLLTVYISVSFQLWYQAMYMAYDVDPFFVAVFFVGIVVLGGILVTQLTTVIITVEYEKAMEEENQRILDAKIGKEQVLDSFASVVTRLVRLTRLAKQQEEEKRLGGQADGSSEIDLDRIATLNEQQQRVGQSDDSSAPNIIQRTGASAFKSVLHSVQNARTTTYENFVRTSTFEYFSLFVIFINTIVMCFEREGMPDSEAELAANMNYFFVVWYTLELGLRFFAAPDFHAYFRMETTWLDILVVAAAWVEVFLSAASYRIPIIGVVRSIRVFKLMILFPHLYVWFQLILRALVTAPMVLLIFFFVVIMFACLFLNILGGRLCGYDLDGTNVFNFGGLEINQNYLRQTADLFSYNSTSGAYIPVDKNDTSVTHNSEGDTNTINFGGLVDGNVCDGLPEANFEGLWMSLVTSFQIATGDDWELVMYTAMQSQGVAMFIPFCAYFYLTAYMLLPLLVGIVLSAKDETQLTETDDVTAGDAIDGAPPAAQTSTADRLQQKTRERAHRNYRPQSSKYSGSHTPTPRSVSQHPSNRVSRASSASPNANHFQINSAASTSVSGHEYRVVNISVGHLVLPSRGSLAVRRHQERRLRRQIALSRLQTEATALAREKAMDQLHGMAYFHETSSESGSDLSSVPSLHAHYPDTNVSSGAFDTQPLPSIQIDPSNIIDNRRDNTNDNHVRRTISADMRFLTAEVDRNAPSHVEDVEMSNLDDGGESMTPEGISANQSVLDTHDQLKETEQTPNAEPAIDRLLSNVPTPKMFRRFLRRQRDAVLDACDVFGNSLRALTQRYLPVWMILSAKLHKLSRRTVYRLLTAAVIVYGTVVLCLKDVMAAPDSLVQRQLNTMEAVFVALYLFDVFIVRAIGLGLFCNKGALLLRSGAWNNTDVLLAVVSFVSLIVDSVPATSTDATANVVLRLIRALRPIMALQYLPGCALITSTIASSVRQLGRVLSITLIVMFVFAVEGVRQYRGILRICYVPTEGFVDGLGRDACEAARGSWTNDGAHFDNIAAALHAVFNIATLEGWADIMHRMMNQAADSNLPRQRLSSPVAALYPIAAVIVVGFIMCSLFASVLVDSYNKEKRLRGDKSVLQERQVDGYLLTQRRIFRSLTIPLQRKFLQSNPILLGTVDLGLLSNIVPASALSEIKEVGSFMKSNFEAGTSGVAKLAEEASRAAQSATGKLGGSFAFRRPDQPASPEQDEVESTAVPVVRKPDLSARLLTGDVSDDDNAPPPPPRKESPYSPPSSPTLVELEGLHASIASPEVTKPLEPSEPTAPAELEEGPPPREVSTRPPSADHSQTILNEQAPATKSPGAEARPPPTKSGIRGSPVLGSLAAKTMEELSAATRLLSGDHENIDLGRSLLRSFVRSPWFINVFHFVVLVYVVSQAWATYPQTRIEKDVQRGFDIAFVAIFTLEFVLKLFAETIMGYFASNWNRLDFFVLAMSIAGVSVSNITGEGGRFALITTLRILRLVRLADGRLHIRELISKISKALVSLGNVIIVIAAVFTVFAVIGMELFGRVQNGVYGVTAGFDKHNNFQTVNSGLMLLLRIMTGGNWPDLLNSAKQQPFNSPCDEQLGACGRAEPIPQLYFDTFLAVSMFVLKNLIVAVLVDAFTASGQLAAESKENAQKLCEAWIACEETELTEDGAGDNKEMQLALRPVQVLKFLRMLPKASVLGFNHLPGQRRVAMELTFFARQQITDMKEALSFASVIDVLCELSFSEIGAGDAPASRLFHYQDPPSTSARTEQRQQVVNAGGDGLADDDYEEGVLDGYSQNAAGVLIGGAVMSMRRRKLQRQQLALRKASELKASPLDDVQRHRMALLRQLEEEGDI